jgi:UDP-glucose 4-epimerase
MKSISLPPGEGGAHPRTELDSVNPLTAYAISKIEMEKRLASLPGNMKTTSLRFATACGPSLALRTDLVLNDFVWSALASGKVEILSDGSPWRPLIDVRDMAKVISWMITNREASSDRHLVVNAGSNAANYQVKEIAETVANSLPGTVLKINTDASPDRRSYKVDFTKFERLTNGAVEFYSLKESTQALVELISSQGFDLSKFDMNTLKRLSIIRALKSSGSLSSLLRWTKN